jgi:4-diphosphocytidyl-2-C-methyl-D-erythritol kinase
MKLSYRAYAKINLLLDVTGVLPNGYHSVVMINQSISLHDVVTVEVVPGRGIEITCDMPGIPTDQRNIVWKACKAFGGDRGLRITLEKHIPSEAGLAGGSTDAAAVLAALRRMFKPEMPTETLLTIGAKVGADVPFCLTGGCCLAEGIGEVLTPLPSLPQSYAVALTKPDVAVSTAAAYAAMDSIQLRRPKTGRAVALAKQGCWEQVLPLCANVFEQVVELPGLAEWKENALRQGALLAQMTGAGSAAIAVFDEKAISGETIAALGGFGDTVAVHKLVPHGVELIQEEST